MAETPSASSPRTYEEVIKLLTKSIMPKEGVALLSATAEQCAKVPVLHSQGLGASPKILPPQFQGGQLGHAGEENLLTSSQASFWRHSTLWAF